MGGSVSLEAPRSKEKGKKKKKKEQTNEGDKEPWLSKGCCLVASGFA
jgi:hypothetical protein